MKLVKKEEKQFSPFDLTIRVETAGEAKRLFVLFNDVQILRFLGLWSDASHSDDADIRVHLKERGEFLSNSTSVECAEFDRLVRRRGA